MQANVGDHMIVRSHRSGQTDREGEILAVRGKKSCPPYLVRWSGTGHESILFPGTDAEVRHAEHTPPPALPRPGRPSRALQEEMAHPGG